MALPAAVQQTVEAAVADKAAADAARKKLYATPTTGAAADMALKANALAVIQSHQKAAASGAEALSALAAIIES